MLLQTPAAGLAPIALQNDYHFWGVVAADVDNKLQLDKPTAIEQWVALPVNCTDLVRSCDNDSDDDYSMTVPASLDMAPVAMSTEEVDAELQLCTCLTTWSPWGAPTDDLNASLAAVRSPSTARRCILRDQVVGHIIWEAANVD